MLSLQAAINMAVSTVSVPTKGLSLPLVSAGGTGLVITAAALGLMYSVARNTPDEISAQTTTAEPALARPDDALPGVLQQNQ
jgi:cell division protein FtsW (lipid II flippase)